MKETSRVAANKPQGWAASAHQTARKGLIMGVSILGLGLATVTHAQDAALPAGPGLGTAASQNAWLDPDVINRTTNQFAVVMDYLQRAALLTNNVEADKVVNEAQGTIQRISKEDLNTVLTGLQGLIQSDRAEAEAMRKKSTELGLAPELSRKYGQLAKDWQGVIASLDLKADEIKAIQTDLGKAVESFDKERDFWRARARFASAVALNEEIGKFIQNLKEIRDRLNTSLAQDGTPKPVTPRPQITVAR
jgi:hypothetical protein